MQKVAVALAGYEREAKDIEQRRKAALTQQVESLTTVQGLCAQLDLAAPTVDETDSLIDTLGEMRDDVAERFAATTVTLSLAERLDDGIKAAREESDRVGAVLTEANKTATEARHATSRTAEEVTRLEGELASQESDYGRQYSELATLLSDFGVEFGDVADPTSFYDVADDLRARRDAWRRSESKARALAQTVSELEAASAHRMDSIEQKKAGIDDTERQLDVLRSDLDETHRQRQEVFGDKDPNAEETRLADDVESTQERLRVANDAAAEAQNELRKLDERISDRRQTWQTVPRP